MSLRYTGAWMQDGAFNPLTAPTPNYTYGLWSWGYNAAGQLGIGDTTSRSSPNQIGALVDWAIVSGNPVGTQVVSVKNDGTLWGWGTNTYGQLGFGNTTNYSSPKQVGGLANWSYPACGAIHSLVVKTDGTLWGYGYGVNGQLGLGNTTTYSSPKQVGALTTWSKVAGGGYSSYAIKTDGTLWSWGYNSSGQLGIGNTTNISSPQQVGALTDWITIAAGMYHAVGIRSNGTLWTWGWNPSGQLGYDTGGASRNSPGQVGSLTTWLKATCGYAHTIALKTDGTLWAFGYNANGQLGDGSAVSKSSPVQIGALTNWSKPATTQSGGMSAVVKTDGTIWTWGANDQGQLGLGNTTPYSSPKQVGSATNWGQPACTTNSVFALRY